MWKSVRIIATASMFLLLAWSATSFSRQDPHDKQKEQEKPQKQDKPAERQKQDAKPVRQDHQQAKRQQDQERPNQQSNGRQDARRQQQQENAKRQEQHVAQQQQDQQRQTQQRRQDDSARQRQPQAEIRNDQRQQQRQRQDNASNPQRQAGTHQDQRQQSSRRQQDNRPIEQRSSARVHQQQAAWRDDRAQSWQSEHRTWQQRGGYNGYRIPEDRFRSYYGQDHGFRIYTLPVRYVGHHRRFQYGGYWFGLIDPWPEYWAADWYDNDDMYVDYYGDGYYLYNRRYPSDRIAISFYLR
jgi:hypothetical protein